VRRPPSEKRVQAVRQEDPVRERKRTRCSSRRAGRRRTCAAAAGAPRCAERGAAAAKSALLLRWRIAQSAAVCAKPARRGVPKGGVAARKIRALSAPSSVCCYAAMPCPLCELIGAQASQRAAMPQRGERDPVRKRSPPCESVKRKCSKEYMAVRQETKREKRGPEQRKRLQRWCRCAGSGRVSEREKL